MKHVIEIGIGAIVLLLIFAFVMLATSYPWLAILLPGIVVCKLAGKMAVFFFKDYRNVP
jgi:hypothetical protein